MKALSFKSKRERERETHNIPSWKPNGMLMAAPSGPCLGAFDTVLAWVKAAAASAALPSPGLCFDLCVECL